VLFFGLFLLFSVLFFIAPPLEIFLPTPLSEPNPDGNPGFTAFQRSQIRIGAQLIC